MKIKDYYIWIILGAVFAFMAFIEKRVWPLYVVSALFFIVGFVFWVMEDAKGNKKKQERKKDGNIQR